MGVERTPWDQNVGGAEPLGAVRCSLGEIARLVDKGRSIRYELGVPLEGILARHAVVRLEDVHKNFRGVCRERRRRSPHELKALIFLHLLNEVARNPGEHPRVHAHVGLEHCLSR